MKNIFPSILDAAFSTVFPQEYKVDLTLTEPADVSDEDALQEEKQGDSVRELTVQSVNTLSSLSIYKRAEGRTVYFANDPGQAEGDLRKDVSEIKSGFAAQGVAQEKNAEMHKLAAVQLLAKAKTYRKLYFDNAHMTQLEKPSGQLAKIIHTAMQIVEKELPQKKYKTLYRAIDEKLQIYDN